MELNEFLTKLNKFLWETKITIVQSGTARVSIPKDVVDENSIADLNKLRGIIVDAETLKNILQNTPNDTRFILFVIGGSEKES